MKRAGVALAFLLIAAAPASAPVLRAEGWTEKTTTLAHDLSQAPAECLAQTSEAIDAGRALFRSTALFGGPVARVGLSCEACHASGRINRHFYLPELSDAPGTVDVTSEWASKVRGDGIRNPVPIPDLVGVRDKTSFGGKHEPSLDAFVRSVIVDEFQGPPPPPAVLDDLVAYLRALDPAACGASPRAITLGAAADDVRRAVTAAGRAAQDGDAATASLLLYAGQDGVARIVERLPPSRFDDARRTLTLLARDLGAMREGDVATKLADARAGWMARFDGTVRRIGRRQSLTYFNARALARAMQTPGSARGANEKNR